MALSSIAGAQVVASAWRGRSTRFDLWARSGPALQLAVSLPPLLDGPVVRQPAVMQHRGAGAELLRRLRAVRDEAEGDARAAEVSDPGLALLLEPLVPHGQDLVDDQDVGLHVLG